MAPFNSSETKVIASLISAAETKLFSKETPSNFLVYFAIALSPFF
jgi:hypothetical protein